MGFFSGPDYVGELAWEAIKPVGGSTKPSSVSRAKVIGGWLIETQNSTMSGSGLTFLPDPHHDWKLNNISNK